MRNGAKTSRERIYEELKNEIFDGRLRPSEVLIVDDLAKRFGVSRTPVREALIALSNKGLLEAKHHIGFIVTSVDVREIMETYRLRILLEKEAVRLAVRNILPANLERLAVAAREPNRYFHSCIAVISGWGVLAETLETLLDKTDRSRSLFTSAQKQLMKEAVRRRCGHPEIFDAIASGDEEKAASFMEIHLNEAQEYVLKAISASAGRNFFI
ncbi:MAG: GntR family transcriptional regulator [Synergistaceae bacterium]|jgi:DNA-binding GntR family transcriptional regulator|nr:GntR family transcriptional regulator [Synergistaceae bacterium]